MSIITIHQVLSGIEILLGILALAFLIRSRELSSYWPLLVVSMWQVIPFGVLLYVQHLGRTRITPHHAYVLYYYTYWTLFFFGAICAVLLTYTILHGAMAPLKGLQQLVKIVYFWAAAISVLMAVQVSASANVDASQLLQRAAIEFQRATGIITVSLAIFVYFAIRPMGLSLRSRVFGTSLGLVILNMVQALQANYLMQHPVLYSKYSMWQIILSCLTELIWIYYFAMPEPKRKFVLLSTTSPFHRWNQIAEQFGQSPGYVAIGGVPPDAFASAEIEIFHRASAKMNALEAPADAAPVAPHRDV